MSNTYRWNLIDYIKNEEIIEAYNEIPSMDNYPAANQWQYILPIIDHYFDVNKTCFAILYSDDKPIFIMPISIFTVKKFFLDWQEIGFPFHNHVNLIKLPNILIDSDVLMNNLITLCKERFGDKWSRFTIRNIQTTVKNIEYCDQVSYFETESHSSTKQIVSKKHLRNIKRLEKKLASDKGDMNFTINTPTLTTSLNEFIDIEKTSWKGKEGVALFSSPRLLDTYNAFSKNFNQDKMVIAKLEIDHKLIASTLGFHLGDTIYIHKISHDQAYSEYAPGNILILKMLEHALNDKEIGTLNLVTSPTWAKRWHPKTTDIRNIVYFNGNNYGKFLKFIIFTWRKYKPSLKSIMNLK